MSSIAFLHPDLGIGGAERLIVDLALALKDCGHSVIIFTSHHNRDHCFEETNNGQIPVITAGDWIPRSTFGSFMAFWAYIRMIYLTIYLILNYRFDLIICDQVPSGVPILKAFKHKCLFYCHFPDQLLSKHDSFLKKIYRFPIDFFEEWAIGYSDMILVNSYFTDEVFHRTFKSLSNISTKVLYPSVNFNKSIPEKIPSTLNTKLKNMDAVFLSINRYEKKKNIELAIEALKALYDKFNYVEEKDRSLIHLIIAGGYDLQNIENLEYAEELNQLAKRLRIKPHVTFMKNLTNEQKQFLFQRCTAVIYTPENEHFGIVPLEAMYMSRPVIAANSGGPRETIINNETGFLCQPNSPESFAEAMHRFIENKTLSNQMGAKGHDHVIEKFNHQKFKNELNKIVTNLILINQHE
ncbi:Alpha-1,3-mannosyltransferase-like protein [Dermatophagoides pteronyssinus]|uniref:Alpha-1,3/1,6-mannosyltransferase ALG2 n=2 Tax=Dermatophagoides pteronyssinus TaxID=6956 RepID=A0A6P6Y0D3_DERPT|nr:alpha-1,3/1,6-mannosyltransferase ALG2-like [Dermatophagoides pteronyssinus]KAH9424239.1 Alpha-1,3-mannosyltransferase-like protein [Dermatophagoides pteronyssinus]